MKITGVLLLLFFLYCQTIFGQTPMTFIGTAAVKNGDTYTYKLEMTDSNGVLKGYSVTDLMGANETKTSITGSIDADKKQIDYRETKIIYTRSKALKSDFCYLSAHLKFADMKGATTLKGHFTCYKEDTKTAVASGKLMLVSAKDVLDKLQQIAKKDSVATAKKQPSKQQMKYEYREEENIPAQSIKKISPGDTLALKCADPSVTIEAWDAKTIDGDIITLLQDNVPILENYTLTALHKHVDVPMKRETSIITLVAISEGSEPLNTARLKITSGKEVYYIDATTTIGKNIVIALKDK